MTPTPLYAFQDHTPQLDGTAWVAPGAFVIGQVTIGPQSSVWFNSVLRGDYVPITIGRGVNIQDLTTVHIETAKERRTGQPCPVVIGDWVTVGHNCIIHGCTIEDHCIIGMGSTLMNGVQVGRGSIIGAGSVVLENTVIPPFSLVVGSPATVKKSYPESILEIIRESADNYLRRAEQFRQTLKTV